MQWISRFRPSHFAALFFAAVAVTASGATETPPVEWNDPATGHRVVRLSVEPESDNLYFHQNPYSPDGRKLVFTTPQGIATVDLQTRAIEMIVPDKVKVLMVGRRSPEIYYIKDRSVYAAHLETRQSRLVAAIPADIDGGTFAINADETILVGVGADRTAKPAPRALPPSSQPPERLGARWAAGTPMVTYTIDLKSGEVKKIHRENDWTNHLQCSPTDPNQILFCHEGPWHFNDRTWLLRTDGTQLTKVHTRTMDMEIAGHEFFSADGKTVWYDLQTPRSLVFWLAGYEIETGKRTWYHLEREHWSVHYNISPDGKLFAGDGGGPASVANRDPNNGLLAKPGNGQWIYLFRPVAVKNRAAGLPGQDGLIQVGYFEAERLADLSKHDYKLEPNVTFTPDGKWIVFGSNMHGPSHVYMVEVAKAQ